MLGILAQGCEAMGNIKAFMYTAPSAFDLLVICTLIIVMLVGMQRLWCMNCISFLYKKSNACHPCYKIWQYDYLYMVFSRKIVYIPIISTMHAQDIWALFQYLIRRLVVRSHEVVKPRWSFISPHRFVIWQAHWQHCCQGACQISKRSYNSKYKCRGFETLQDLTLRHHIRYWNGPCRHRDDPSSGLHWWLMASSSDKYVLTGTMTPKQSEDVQENCCQHTTGLTLKCGFFYADPWILST